MRPPIKIRKDNQKQKDRYEACLFVFGEQVPTLIEKYILFLMACIYYIWSE